MPAGFYKYKPKLTEANVEEICRRHALGKANSTKAIAADFNITPAYVTQLAYGYAYRQKKRKPQCLTPSPISPLKPSPSTSTKPTSKTSSGGMEEDGPLQSETCSASTAKRPNSSGEE